MAARNPATHERAGQARPGYLAVREAIAKPSRDGAARGHSRRRLIRPGERAPALCRAAVLAHPPRRIERSPPSMGAPGRTTMVSTTGARGGRWYYGWNIVAVAVLSLIAANGVPFNCISLFLKPWSGEFPLPI